MALLIGVISCGVVVVLAGVGVARARAPRARRARAPAPRPAAPDAEMAWDDSALTITVNPMEEVRVAVPTPRPASRRPSHRPLCLQSGPAGPAGGAAATGLARADGAVADSSDGESCSDSDSDRHDSSDEDEEGKRC